MWTEVSNSSSSSSSLHGETQDYNATQIVSPVSSRLTSSSHKNGSVTASPPPPAETPVNRESGIIPGVIAAAVFIGFLLALYAVLWKCMVMQPKRRKKRKRSLKTREQKSLTC